MDEVSLIINNVPKWLRGSKMKTRVTFVLILRFLPLYKQDFMDLLVFLKPFGKVFFNKFVATNPMFDEHKVIKTHRHSLKYPKSYLNL